jgi:probable addiction module antidote protein
MTVKLTRYDTAEHLKTDEDIQAYLDAVLEEGGDDPAYIIHALGIIARAKNMSQLARDTGLSREGLYKALSEEGNPTFATVTKVAKALGLQIKFQSAA